MDEARDIMPTKLPDRDPTSWQQKIILPFAWFIVAGGIFTYVLFLFRNRDFFTWQGLIGLSCVTGIAISLSLGVGWRMLSMVVITSLTLVGMVFPTTLGLRAGPLMFAALAVNFAAALHGRRVAGAVLAVQFAALIGVGLAAERGWVQPMGFVSGSLAGLGDWVRGSVVFAVAAALQSGFLYYVVRSLRQSRHETRAEQKLREKSEENLRESERLLKIFGEISQDYVYTVDTENPTLKPQLVTGAFDRTTGYTPEAIEKSGGWLSVVHPADQVKVKSLIPLLQNGEEAVIEYRILAPGGQVKWLRDHIYPIRDTKSGKVIRLIGGVHDITENRRLAELAENLTLYDQVTGLANRAHLMQRLVGIAGESAEKSGAIIYVDLDNFKKLNDLHGHETGDKVLLVTVERLRALQKPAMLLARLGADEFAFLLTDLGNDLDAIKIAVNAFALQVSNAVRLPIPVQMTGQVGYEGTASIGIAYFGQLLKTIASGEVLRQADAAMCRAKELGRNRIIEYTPDLMTAVIGRLSLESDLAAAFKEKQLHLHYQVQLDTKRRALGVEVLLRWYHPKRGIVMPGEFIPLAEETGLIEPIGYWVIEEACKQLTIWSRKPAFTHLKIAVNVSARQFRLADFVENVRKIVVSSGAPADKLEFELTESLMLSNISETTQKMHELRILGLSLSLDDFGTGHSSLAYLKRLPLTQLKIDQSFVRDIREETKDAVIVSTIIGMARNLHLDVIAEGVETEAQFKFLMAHDCAAFQGYLFAKPVSLAEFETAINNGKF